MATKSVAATRPVPLPGSMVKNNETARSDIIRSLSSCASWVVGYVKGGDTLDSDTDNTSPRSPMHGLRGHTHSGGLDGRPLFRTIASINLDDHATHSSNVETQVGVNNVVTFGPRPQGSPPAAPALDPGDGSGKWAPVGPLLPIFVPGCDPADGAYNRLGWRAHLDVRTSTNSSTGDTFTLRITNTTNNARCSDSRSVWASTGLVYNLNSDADGERLSVVPGRWNILQVSAKYETDNTAGTRDIEIALTALELGVYET